MNTNHFSAARSVGIAVGCILLVACASEPPPPQLAVAASTLSDAERAGAVQYAPVELNRARDELARAKDAMHDGKSQEARRLADEAEADAKLAAVKTQAAQADQAASTVRQDQMVLRNETVPLASSAPARLQ
jgi:Domain of unknown function (DUF4398)